MAAQDALEALVEHMTLRQLADKTGRSVGEIVEWAMAGSSRAGKSARGPVGKPRAAPKAKAVSAGAVDVRNAAGRAAYDAAVLNVLVSSKGPAPAQEVRRVAGGTPMQARAALNRLIESGKVGYKGRARATRYFTK